MIFSILQHSNKKYETKIMKYSDLIMKDEDNFRRMEQGVIMPTIFSSKNSSNWDW